MKNIVIAIDGYSACGKSSTAKVVAGILNYNYIDTGAMYRAITYYFIEHYINLSNPKQVKKALEQIHIDFVFNPKIGASETYLNGLNVEKEIRSMEVSNLVSEVSAIAEVRNAMVPQQRKMGKKKGIVMDGRDIGTTVFPDAELKIFMKADFQTRAERRQKELLESNQLVDLVDIMENLKKRDEIDTTRKESPLKKAKDALEIDTTHLTFEEQVEEILYEAAGKMIDEQKFEKKKATIQ
jgi:CMP/dCMP kinase